MDEERLPTVRGNKMPHLAGLFATSQHLSSPVALSSLLSHHLSSSYPSLASSLPAFAPSLTLTRPQTQTAWKSCRDHHDLTGQSS